MASKEARSTNAGSARARLERIIQSFVEAPTAVRLQALLDYGDRLEASTGVDAPTMEVVPECTVPVAVGVTTDSAGAVRLHLQVPPEPGTLRGYAGMLHDALDGATVAEILEVPDDVFAPLVAGDPGADPHCLQALVSTLTVRVADLDDAPPVA